MQDSLVLFSILLALLAGIGAGKVWERYKLQEGRWIDLHENDLDEARLADWITQASRLPGFMAKK